MPQTFRRRYCPSCGGSMGNIHGFGSEVKNQWLQYRQVCLEQHNSVRTCWPDQSRDSISNVFFDRWSDRIHKYTPPSAISGRLPTYSKFELTHNNARAVRCISGDLRSIRLPASIYHNFKAINAMVVSSRVTVGGVGWIDQECGAVTHVVKGWLVSSTVELSTTSPNPSGS